MLKWSLSWNPKHDSESNAIAVQTLTVTTLFTAREEPVSSSILQKLALIQYEIVDHYYLYLY